MQYLSGRFEEALALANRLHSTQVREGTDVPYVSHLMAVTSIVLEHGGTQDEAIAALFHDSVKDEGGPSLIGMIRELFGNRAADILTEINRGFACKARPGVSWHDRRQTLLDSLPGHGPSAKLVIAADALHDAASILKEFRREGGSLWLRLEGGEEGFLWYYRSLLGIFEQTGPKSLARELRLVVEQVEHLAGRYGWSCEPSNRRSPGPVRRGDTGRNRRFAVTR